MVEKSATTGLQPPDSASQAVSTIAGEKKPAGRRGTFPIESARRESEGLPGMPLNNGRTRLLLDLMMVGLVLASSILSLTSHSSREFERCFLPVFHMTKIPL